MFQMEALDHVALYVQDMQQSIDWYQSVLGMEQRTQYKDTTGLGNPVLLCSGDACIALFPSPLELPVQRFDGHIAMRLTRTGFEQIHEHLHQHGFDCSIVHYTRCDSLYIDDPTGYQIELSTYEMK